MFSEQELRPGWVRVVQGGAGSIVPVSVQGCQIACEMLQPACTSFSYNPTVQQCFPKQGGQRATCASQYIPCYEANQNLQVRSLGCLWNSRHALAGTFSLNGL